MLKLYGLHAIRQHNGVVDVSPSMYYRLQRGLQLIMRGGLAPSRLVGVSASVNFPLHHKVQKFSSDAGSPGWSRKKGHKTVVVVLVVVVIWQFPSSFCLLDLFRAFEDRTRHRN